MSNIKQFLQQYFRIAISFLITLLLVRVYEYFTVGIKSFTSHSYSFEFAGLFYDVWTWLIYCFIFLFLFLPICFINIRFAKTIFHAVNIILLILYISLIVVFSERNIPFDHEFFTRSIKDSFLTSKQMMTSGFLFYLPYIVYTILYFLFYNRIIKKINFHQNFLTGLVFISLLSSGFVKYASPSENWFKQNSSYYLVCNKLNYWLMDSYQYFDAQHKSKNNILTPEQLNTEIEFYQKNQPFKFINNEYPLLHLDESKDVLGDFFNFNKTTPNIVLLVIEGLSKDFSGANAYAGSFTPFLDSLSNYSLYWDNFLSTAPGTFAAHPAIEGSLPYGSKGFSLMNVLPEHLSLIKILRQNGYWTNFMIGFNPDFDNMGGFIRLQGTDFILSRYPAKYKEMGIGPEGWSMGYPDDALFSRSIEVMDSLHKAPYFNIYHTGTTHMPYLFAQKPLYEKLFQKKMKSMNDASGMKKTLNNCKDVLETYMFSDDCMRKFFADYSKSKDFKNTIFIITGDHHIGSFPANGDIDSYHVPLIIYSPMLKAAKKFHSVNSHNNLAPTITSLLFHHFYFTYQPKDVHWMGDVLDTCTSFRNIHSMPFMSWSRAIEDYIYKEYFVSGDQLYKLTPDLLQEPYKNDSLKNFIIKLRENFKILNTYVCDSNKLFPVQEMVANDDRQLLLDYCDTLSKTIFANTSDTSLMNDFKIPQVYKFLYVEISADVNLPSRNVDFHPSMRLALIDRTPTKNNYLYWAMREVAAISKYEFVPQQWNAISTKDMFTLDDYKKNKGLVFNLGIWTDSIPINFKMKDLKVKIYGVKAKN